MTNGALAHRIVAEGLGTAFLVTAVVGSGIMAAKLAGGNSALALLCNTLPTGAILIVLILVFGPLSGAHFNPAVSLVFAVRGKLSWPHTALYMASQIAGGLVGVIAAHAMFDLPLLQLATTVRSGPGQWLAEGVATFGLVLTILGCLERTPSAIPYAVGLYITAAYWFTASTSFANPAVTIARAFSDSFAGIAPPNVAAFVVAQVGGALLAMVLSGWLFAVAAQAASRNEGSAVSSGRDSSIIPEIRIDSPIGTPIDVLPWNSKRPPRDLRRSAIQPD